jgi:U4/U6.U5 tri-snRNP-associated protein 1
LGRYIFTLTFSVLEVASDYMDPSNIKVRKPKKKKPKSTRKKTVLDDDVLNPTLSMDPAASASADGDVMQLDESSAFIPVRRIRKIAEDISFVDDDDLQSQLALQRRLALKKRKIMKPSDMARQVRGELENETSTPGAMEIDENGDEEVGLIIDGTSEFVATLRARTIPDRKVSTAPTAKNEGNKDSEEEDSDDDVDMVRDERSPKPEPSPTTSVLPTITSTGLDEETTISCGVGTTLAMLNQRGLLKRDPDAEKKIELARDRDRFRMEKRLREIEAEERAKAARARDRQSGKFERMSAREKEEHARWENKQRDVQEAREMQQRFKDYKPDVNLSYKDEFGREMNQKEVCYNLSNCRIFICICIWRLANQMLFF